jgi:hypothetical protein
MRPVVKETHARRRAGTDVFTGNRQMAKPMLNWIGARFSGRIKTRQ